MIQLVVFDMAGTTVDEDNLVYKTLRQSIEAAGHLVTLEQVLALGAGKEKRQAIVDLLESLSVPEPYARSAGIYADFSQRLSAAYHSAPVQPCAGAEAVFRKLREQGVKVALNTGYHRAIATLLLQRLGWALATHFDLLVTADEVARGRPHADMIHLAMHRLGIAEAQAVAKIGDSTVDIREGQAAGCGLTVGITTGAHSRAQLEAVQPDQVVDGLEEMLGLVQKA